MISYKRAMITKSLIADKLALLGLNLLKKSIERQKKSMQNSVSTPALLTPPDLSKHVPSKKTH